MELSERQSNSPNRAAYMAVGVIVMLFAGLVYAWTVLQAPIAAANPQWGAGELSLTFTITMSCWCLGGMASGSLQKRIGVRRLLLAAGVMYLAAFICTSQAHSLPLLYVGFGVLGGLACGAVYNTVLAVASAWYRDKQGFVSGVMLMAFGFSSFLVGKVYAAVTPTDGSDAWRSSLLVLGVLVFAVIAFASFVLRFPPADWEPGGASAAKAAVRSYEEIGPLVMVRRLSFWLLFAWATFITFSAMAVISQGTPIALEASPGLDISTVATIVGMLSICNGIGRILFGIAFDRFGYRVVMLVGGLGFVVASGLLAATLIGHSTALLVVSYAGIGLAYGSVSSTNSAFVNRFYGSEHYPQNLPIINLNILISSFGSTIAGFVFDATGSYLAIVALAAGIVAVGTVLACFIKKPAETLEMRQ